MDPPPSPQSLSAGATTRVPLCLSSRMKDCSERVAHWVAPAGELLFGSNIACIIVGLLASVLLVHLRRTSVQPGDVRLTKIWNLRPFDIFFICYNTTFLPLLVALFLSTRINTTSFIFTILVALRDIGLSVSIIYLINLILASTHRTTYAVHMIRRYGLPSLMLPIVTAAAFSAYAGHLRDILYTDNELLLAADASAATGTQLPSSIPDGGSKQTVADVERWTADFETKNQRYKIVHPLAVAISLLVAVGNVAFLAVAWLESRRELEELEYCVAHNSAGDGLRVFAGLRDAVRFPALRDVLDLRARWQHAAFGRVRILSPISVTPTTSFWSPDDRHPIPPVDIRDREPATQPPPPLAPRAAVRPPRPLPPIPTDRAPVATPALPPPILTTDTTAQPPTSPTSPSSLPPTSPAWVPPSPSSARSKLPYNPDRETAAREALRRNMRSIAWIALACAVWAGGGVASLIVASTRGGTGLGNGRKGTAEVTGFVVEHG
ncbi:hypothetical protein DFJ73DRAFT_921406 [Zopfochytrium polystomum]|nr:hypothetical protein DFJ73DRAFT_921406 [Zopfochytrium polystomum]